MNIMPLLILVALFAPIPIYMATYKPEMPQNQQKQLIESSPKPSSTPKLIYVASPTPSPAIPQEKELPSEIQKTMQDVQPMVICKMNDGTQKQVTYEECDQIRAEQLEETNKRIDEYNKDKKQEYDAYLKMLEESNVAAQQLSNERAKQLEDVNKAVEEANQKLYEACKANAYSQYPESINGESPERRNLRSQTLTKCFNTYLQ